MLRRSESLKNPCVNLTWAYEILSPSNNKLQWAALVVMSMKVLLCFDSLYQTLHKLLQILERKKKANQLSTMLSSSNDLLMVMFASSNTCVMIKPDQPKWPHLSWEPVRLFIYLGPVCYKFFLTRFYTKPVFVASSYEENRLLYK
jgi:hypothetical protein